MSDQNVPECSKEDDGGNTRTPSISPALYWCFTLNNYTEEELIAIKSTPCSKVPILVFQKEVGESGTPHIQGALKFSKKSRPSVLKLSIRIHWEKMKAKDKRDGFNYCLKDDTNDGEQYIRGYDKPYKVNIELKQWQQDLVDIIRTEPDDRTIVWIWEPTGCKGKTTFGKYLYQNEERCIILEGKSTDVKNGIVQYIDKSHTFPRTVIVNIARDCKKISYSGIEQIKDMFFYSGKYEGGMICGKSPHVIVFANTPPDESKLSLDRWKIFQID